MPRGKPKKNRVCRFCGLLYLPNGSKDYYCGNGCRFFDHVAPSDYCWDRNSAICGNGYSYVRREKAHRLSYEYFKGPIPPQKDILHSCDNPRCVNPKHLRYGTAKENGQDKKERGRGKGVKNNLHNAKRKPEEIVELRRLAAERISRKELSLKFDLSAAQVSRIINRQKWKNI